MSEDAFRLIVLPDMQAYNDIRLGITQKLFGIEDQREVMRQQVRWVAKVAHERRVAMVLQEGDLTQTNYQPEWEMVSEVFAELDGVVPYMVSLGNHDMGYLERPAPGKFWTCNQRDSLLSDYFPPSRFRDNPLYRDRYGGSFENSSENYYLLFDAGGTRFMVLTLEFLPRPEVLDWANAVVGAHADRHCILLTHAFLDIKGERVLRSDHYAIQGLSPGAVWDRFVSRHQNIFLVLCGHDYGESRRSDRGIHGNLVHQVLANYQWWERGGMGWLRILTFLPSEGRIQFETYSPVLDRYRRAPASEFTLAYQPIGPPGRIPGLSLLQQRKLHHFFSLVDHDRNDSISETDLFAFRDAFANILGLHLDEPRYKRVTIAMHNLWAMLQSADRDSDGHLRFEELVAHWSRVLSVAETTEAARGTFEHLDALGHIIFDTIDVSGDGTIGVMEFWLFLKAIGIGDGYMHIFKGLDLDQDGAISRAEWNLHVRQFFLGDDPAAPANDLFGQLR